jgi:hypothetical protein
VVTLPLAFALATPPEVWRRVAAARGALPSHTQAPSASRVLALLLPLVLGACELRDRDALFVLRSPDETGIAFANVLAEDDSV